MLRGELREHEEQSYIKSPPDLLLLLLLLTKMISGSCFAPLLSLFLSLSWSSFHFLALLLVLMFVASPVVNRWLLDRE